MSNALVLQNKRDEAMEKIGKFRETNIMDANNVGKAEKLNEAKRRIVYYFLELAGNNLTVSKDQLKTMNQEQLKEVANFIAEKARKRAFLQACFYIFPVIGWMVFTFRSRMIFTSFWYLYYRKILMNAYGENYFPYNNLMVNDIFQPLIGLD